MTAQLHARQEVPDALPNPFWLLPAGALIGSAWFIFSTESGALLQHAFIGAMWGAFGAVPVVIVAAFLLIGLHNRRVKATWKRCSVDWYRSAYPEHALPDGTISCRHCGALRVYPRNIAGHKDVRACACGQCGATLFYYQD